MAWQLANQMKWICILRPLQSKSEDQPAARQGVRMVNDWGEIGLIRANDSIIIHWFVFIVIIVITVIIFFSGWERVCLTDCL